MSDREEHPALGHFRELNALPKKVPAAERMKQIKEQFPSVEKLDWNEAFKQDIGLMGAILRDVLKIDLSTRPGVSGPRPGVDPEEGRARLRQLLGQDYTNLPFHEAFEVLAGGRSYTHLARKTGLSRSKVFRLAKNMEQPSVDELRQVAEAFKKHPSFFFEYRTYYVAAAMQQRMEHAPEASITAYRKIVTAAKEDD